MDFRGQKWSERIYYLIVILFGAVSWIVGYVKNDFFLAFYGWLIGLGLSLLICIPDWPFYNMHKVEWLSEIPDRSDPKNITTTGKSKVKKSKK